MADFPRTPQRSSRRLALSFAAALGAALAGIAACQAPSTGVSVQPSPASPQVVVSPNGGVVIRFSIDSAGTPQYGVSYKGSPVVQDSPLGLSFAKGGALAGLAVTALHRESHDEKWRVVAGATSSARDHYNELTVDLRERAGARRELNLVFRAYDDGAAFRYVIPKQAALDSFAITAERSTFRFAGDYRAWAPNYGSFTSSYETEYAPTSLDSIKPDAIVGLPITMRRADGTTLALTEAALVDYAGMYVGGTGDGAHGLVSKLSPLPNGGGVLVRGTAPHASPWRVIMLGESAGDLVESTLVLNLNAPSAIGDVSWIEPGKVMFPWWPDFRTDADSVANPEGWAATPARRINFANQKYNVDFAAEYGIRYIELEPPWYGDEKQAIEKPLTMDITRAIPELRLPALLAEAKARGVGFLVWAHWESVRAQMEDAFATYERWGVKGVKIDFMNRDDQEMVRWYQAVLESAARHHLVVYFHGAYKPTGTERTWPNLLTHEAVMGLEYNKWSHRSTPEHNVTLPFTRMLAGPMDYTPGGFTNVRPDEFKESYSRPMVMTTRAQQLAMYVVYLSPLQMVADYPGAYRGRPEAAFIRDVPTSWDETRVLAGEVGDYVAIARRHGDDWYVGAMTDGSARTLALPLRFLGTGAWRATIYRDGADANREPTQVTVDVRAVGASDTLTAALASGGGYAVRLTRVR